MNTKKLHSDAINDIDKLIFNNWNTITNENTKSNIQLFLLYYTAYKNPLNTVSRENIYDLVYLHPLLNDWFFDEPTLSFGNNRNKIRKNDSTKINVWHIGAPIGQLLTSHFQKTGNMIRNKFTKQSNIEFVAEEEHMNVIEKILLDIFTKRTFRLDLSDITSKTKDKVFDELIITSDELITRTESYDKITFKSLKKNETSITNDIHNNYRLQFVDSLSRTTNITINSDLLKRQKVIKGHGKPDWVIENENNKIISSIEFLMEALKKDNYHINNIIRYADIPTSLNTIVCAESFELSDQVKQTLKNKNIRLIEMNLYKHRITEKFIILMKEHF